jgi:hypothetical protein
MIRVNIRARYSPTIPSANICAPEKIEIADARKTQPGTIPPNFR